MRKVKFFPVIKGKNIDVDTNKGIKGTAKTPNLIILRKILLVSIMSKMNLRQKKQWQSR